ncbi:MAG: flagellar motor protein MotB, partial [Chitinophagaceae bacterium]
MQSRNYIATIILAISLFAINTSRAQYVLNEADKNYELYNYKKAIDLYEQAYQKKQTLYAAEKLGECYSLVNNSIEAESWYGIAVKMPNSKPENILSYAKALQRNAKYSEAKDQFQQYAKAQKEVTAKQLNLWVASCDSAAVWMKDPKKINIANEAKLNSPQSDWGAGWHLNKLVYASDRAHVGDDKENGSRPFLKFDTGEKPSKTVSGWTGRSYLRLYTGTDTAAKFPIAAGTSYHIGAPSFA